MGTLYNLRHLRLAGVTIATRQHRDAHTVAIKGMHGITFAHKDILTAIIGHKDIVAIAFAAERAHHIVIEVHALVNALSLACQIIVKHEVVNHIHHQHLGRVGECF